MLSKEELSRYGTATLTSVFLDRVFQECLTYDGEMVRQIRPILTMRATLKTPSVGQCVIFSSNLCLFTVLGL